MAVGGAFLGGPTGDTIPAGQCLIVVQTITDDRTAMAKALTIANTSHSYTLTTGVDGYGQVYVSSDGGDYTVTITSISGYLNALPQTVTPASKESRLVRFDLIKATSMADLMYPIGSIYMSVNNVNPGSFLGGTWVAYAEGRTILGVNAGHPVGQTGGAETVTLNETQMPVHNHSTTSDGAHTLEFDTQGAGSHSHSINASKQDASYLGGGGQHPIEQRDSGINTNSVGDHTHHIKADGVGGHGHTTENKGGNQPHENMMPFIATYIWKRTA